MFSWDSEYEICSRFVFELVIWPNRLLWKDELNPRVRCAFGNVYFLSLFFSNMKTGWWYHLVPGGLSLQHAHCAFVAIQSCIKIINEKYKHCIYTAYTAQVPRAYSGYIAFTAYTFYTVWQTVRLFQLLEQLLCSANNLYFWPSEVTCTF